MPLLIAAFTASRPCSLINPSKGKINDIEVEEVEDDSWDKKSQDKEDDTPCDEDIKAVC